MITGTKAFTVESIKDSKKETGLLQKQFMMCPSPSEFKAQLEKNLQMNKNLTAKREGYIFEVPLTKLNTVDADEMTIDIKHMLGINDDEHTTEDANGVKKPLLQTDFNDAQYSSLIMAEPSISDNLPCTSFTVKELSHNQKQKIYDFCQEPWDAKKST